MSFLRVVCSLCCGDLWLLVPSRSLDPTPGRLRVGLSGETIYGFFQPRRHLSGRWPASRTAGPERDGRCEKTWRGCLGLADR
jgi:hypothetical protein